MELELINKAQQGDRAAFGELVRRHRTGVINIVYRMCGDINLAEDMAQEAFLRAWQKLASYQPRSPFRNMNMGAIFASFIAGTRAAFVLQRFNSHWISHFDSLILERLSY